MNRFAEIRKKLMEANRFVFYFQVFLTSFLSVENVYPISSHFASSSSRISPLVLEVLCSSTMAPGWIRPRSLSKASSLDGCKTPEEGMISHVFCHLQIFSTVFSLWRPVEAGHGFACDIFIQSFHTLKFSRKCLLCCNLGHVGVMESMVADGMTFF